jgi:hypothetical protein
VEPIIKGYGISVAFSNCTKVGDDMAKDNKANKLYSIVTETPEKHKNLVHRCCDFKKLEAILEKRTN